MLRPNLRRCFLTDVRRSVVLSSDVLDPMCLDKSCHSWGRTGPTRGSQSSITQSLSKRPDNHMVVVFFVGGAVDELLLEMKQICISL